MNKRKAKKKKKKEEMFLSIFCSSYKECKKFNREFHQWSIESERYKKYKQLHNIKDEIDLLFE